MGNETSINYRQLEFAPVQAKIKRLQSDRRYRDDKELFFAEGIRNFVEAVDHKYPIDVIIYSEKLLTSPIGRKLTRQLKRSGTPFARVSPEQFRAVSQTERASGIAAIFRQQILKLDEIKPNDHLCWIALSHIRSLGNLGTLIRTSAATGAGGFIFIGEQIDPFDPSVVRATMGALFKQKIARARAEQFHEWVKSRKLQVIGASPNGSINYDEVCYTPPTVLLLGNERKGLTSDERQICQKLVRIPMTEGTDSLNVAVAGSLLLYEVFRSLQRK
jgi:TrmH family RNA methyltransferase